MRIRKPDYISVYAENSKKDFNFTDIIIFNDIKISVVDKTDSLVVNLVADNTPVRYIRLRWNFTESEIRRENIKILGDEWERSYGLMEWRGISAQRCMPWAFMVSNGTDRCRDYNNRKTECFGVKVRPKAMCFWQYDTDGIILWLDVRSGGDGVKLGNRNVELCEVLFKEYADMSAFSAAKLFYKSLCNDKLDVRHKIYGTNNWYYAYGNSSHDDILLDTRNLAERCKGLKNIPYMVIDDGWEQNNADAPWNVLRNTFSDMKKLADEIRNLGAKPGIWFRPLCDGTRTSGCIKPEHRLSRNEGYLDPSHPDVLNYISKTVKMLTEDWGYEFIKHDFSTYDIFGFWGFERPAELAKDGWHFWDRSKTSAEIVLQFYRTIKEAAGKAIILGCDTLGHLAAGLVHLNRSGDDTSGKDWERVRNYGVNTLAFRMPHHNAFYEIDADCIGITDQIDWKLNREWLRALSASGTPMFVSPAPHCMSDDIISELKEAYSRNSIQKDILEPLDWMENVCPEHWLLNGEEVFFNWYPKNGVNSFNPN